MQTEISPSPLESAAGPAIEAISSTVAGWTTVITWDFATDNSAIAPNEAGGLRLRGIWRQTARARLNLERDQFRPRAKPREHPSQAAHGLRVPYIDLQ
jgi:hypothetical protein